MIGPKDAFWVGATSALSAMTADLYRFVGTLPQGVREAVEERAQSLITRSEVQAMVRICCEQIRAGLAPPGAAGLEAWAQETVEHMRRSLPQGSPARAAFDVGLAGGGVIRGAGIQLAATACAPSIIMSEAMTYGAQHIAWARNDLAGMTAPPLVADVAQRMEGLAKQTAGLADLANQGSSQPLASHIDLARKTLTEDPNLLAALDQLGATQGGSVHPPAQTQSTPSHPPSMAPQTTGPHRTTSSPSLPSMGGLPINPRFTLGAIPAPIADSPPSEPSWLEAFSRHDFARALDIGRALLAGGSRELALMIALPACWVRAQGLSGVEAVIERLRGLVPLGQAGIDLLLVAAGRKNPALPLSTQVEPGLGLLAAAIGASLRGRPASARRWLRGAMEGAPSDSLIAAIIRAEDAYAAKLEGGQVRVPPVTANVTTPEPPEQDAKTCSALEARVETLLRVGRRLQAVAILDIARLFATSELGPGHPQTARITDRLVDLAMG